LHFSQEAYVSLRVQIIYLSLFRIIDILCMIGSIKISEALFKN